MPRGFQVPLVRQVQLVARSKWARPTAALVTLLLVLPVAALAQGSPFDTGFNAIQSLFTGTIAKVASLVAIVIGGYGFAHGEPGAKKGTRRCCRRDRHCRPCGKRLDLALGCIENPVLPCNSSPFTARTEGLMPEQNNQNARTNRVFKSLHKPLNDQGISL